MSLEEVTDCCEIEYSFSSDWDIKNLPYKPNECGSVGVDGGLELTATLLRAPVAYEIFSGGMTVDDDIGFAVNKAVTRADIFEPGQHLVTLGADPDQDFPGGLSECNGQHTISRGKFIVAVPAQQVCNIGLFDNHGIETFVTGSIIIRPVSPP